MAKSFDKLGCLAYLCKTSNEAWYLSGILEVLQAVGVQIVILDGPEIYPYTYVEDMENIIDRGGQLDRGL